MASVLVLITGHNVVEYHTHPVCKGAPGAAGKGAQNSLTKNI